MQVPLASHILGFRKDADGSSELSTNAYSETIRRLREQKQWSQEQLADIAGLGLRTVQRIENGSPASKMSLMALAAAFNVEVELLVSAPPAQRGAVIIKLGKAVSLGRHMLWLHAVLFGLSLLPLASLALASADSLIWLFGITAIWSLAIMCHGFFVALGQTVLNIGLEP